MEAVISIPPFVQNLYFSIINIGILFGLATTIGAWKYRTLAGAKPFIGFVLSATLVSVSFLGTALSRSPEIGFSWVRFRFLAQSVVPMSFFLFCLGFTGQSTRIDRRLIAALLLAPAITLIVVSSGPNSDFLFREWQLVNYEFISIEKRQFAAFVLPYFVYGSLLMLTGSVILARYLRQLGLTHRNALLIIVFVVLGSPIFEAIAWIFPNNFPLNPSPIRISLSVMAFTWVLFGQRLFDVVPIAYGAVFSSMRDAVLILDAHDKIVQVNHQAESALNQTQRSLIGLSLGELPLVPQLQSASNYQPSKPIELFLPSRNSNVDNMTYEVTISPLHTQNEHFLGRLIVLHDITERKQAEESLQRQNRYLAALHQITLDLLNRRDMGNLLQAVIENAAALLDAPYGELMLKDGNELVLTAVTSNFHSLLGQRSGRDEAVLSWQVYDTKQPVTLNDYATFVSRMAIYDPFVIHATLLVPILIGQNCIGILELSRNVPNTPFTAEQIQQGVLFSQLVALVLDTNTLYQAALRELTERSRVEEILQQQTYFLSTLYQITLDLLNKRDMNDLLQAVIKGAANLLEVSYSELTLLEGDELVVRAVTPADSTTLGDRARRGEAVFSWQAYDSKQPIICDDYSAWQERRDIYNQFSLHAIVLLPILIGQECIGILGLGHDNPSARFTDEQIKQGVLFSQLVALVLDNNNLYQVTLRELVERKRIEEILQRQNQYLATLHQITLDLLNHRDTHDLLQAVIEGASALLDAPHGELSLIEGDELVTRAAMPDQQMLLGDRAGRGEALTSWKAHDTQQPNTLDDYATWAARREIYNSFEIHAILNIPILIAQDCIGILALGRNTPNYPFTAEQIHQGVLFSQMAALVLDNSNLYQAALREITERTRIENALRESERQYRHLLESVPVPLIVMDLETGDLAYANPATGNTLPGISSLDNNVLITLRSLLSPDEYEKLLERCRQTEENVVLPATEYTLHLADRQVIYITAQSTRIHYADRPALLMAVNNITPVKRALQAEAEQRRFNEALLDIMAAINGTLRFSEVVDRIFTNLSKMVTYNQANLMLIEDGFTRTVASRGYAERDQMALSGRYSVDTRKTFRQMIDTRAPLLVEDVKASPYWNYDTTRSTIGSYLGAPILQGTNVIGFVNLDSNTPNNFKAQDGERLQAFASHIAIALRNAQTFERVHEDAITEERQRLARELHDAVSQTLFSAKITAESLPYFVGSNPEYVQQGLAQLIKLTTGALSEMRTLLIELRPSALYDSELDILMSHLVNSLRTRINAEVAYALNGTPVMVPVDVKLSLYRIAQESLNNIAKHANPQQVEIVLQYDQDGVCLRVADDGLGFAIDSISAERMGLRIMQERAATASITLTIESGVNNGTTIEARWGNANDPRDGGR